MVVCYGQTRPIHPPKLPTPPPPLSLFDWFDHSVVGKKDWPTIHNHQASDGEYSIGMGFDLRMLGRQ